MELYHQQHRHHVASEDFEQLQRATALTMSSESQNKQTTSTVVAKEASSVEDDSAYVAGPGSLSSSSSSSAYDDDDDAFYSADNHAKTYAVDAPVTSAEEMTAAAAERRLEMRKKRSCPAPPSFTSGPSEDDGFQRLALSDDETGGPDLSHYAIGNKSIVGQSGFTPAGIPAYAMISVTGSNRRRLGQRRSNAPSESLSSHVDTGAAEDSDRSAAEAGNHQNGRSAAPKPRVSQSDSQNPVLERNPSSLFYLDYIDEEPDDDEGPAVQHQPFARANLSSSRKFSAAAYAPRIVLYPPSDYHVSEDNETADFQHIGNTKASGHSRPRVIRVEEYEDTLRQIDALTKVFRLSDDVYKRIKTLLNTEMDRGLCRNTHHVATVKMFYTHVRRLPDGSESGRYMALDLGGTNFRVLLVDLKGNRQPDVVSKVYLIPLRIMLGPGEQLFDHIAKCIAEFAELHGVKHERLPLGFTFSFPCVQEGLASARLVRWTKGFKCSGVENEDVVKLLHEAIARRGDLSLECIAIINDNVGVLMAGAQKDANCRVGLILGTGTNSCYVEDLDKVEMWPGDFEEPRKMIINTEWGAFGDNGVLDFVRNQFDKRLDVSSVNPGQQLFEKMISGMYMGEIVRLVLCDLALRGIIFRGKDCDEVFEPQRFYTKYISEIESDDPAGDYPNTRMVLQELLKCEPSRDDCRYVQHVCWQVSHRAAFLAGTAIAVVIDRLDMEDVTVAVDGSLYRFHPHFKDLMYKKIAQLIGTQKKFKLMLADDGSGQGAALVAALADKDNQRRQQHNNNDANNNGNKIIVMH